MNTKKQKNDFFLQCYKSSKDSTTQVPVRIISEANNTDHWTKKNKRKKEIKFFILFALKNKPKPTLPCKIILTRVAPRPLDVDNLWSAMKKPIDVVCDWILPGLAPGQSDGDDRIQVLCEQRRGGVKEYALEIGFCCQDALKQE